MKTLCYTWLILFLGLAGSHAVAWEDSYESLLQKYVRKDGVRYAAWHGNQEDRQLLEGVIHAIANTKLAGMTEDEKLAFYLNAYNAWILKTVLDHYPTKSIKDTMFFVFSRDIITVAGEKMSFQDLENDVIRKQFKDSRIHFALNCASLSCPPLHGRAFRAEALDQTLTKLTTAFIRNNPLGVKLGEGGKTVMASRIFDWYKEDFEREAGSVLGFLAKYREEALPKDATLRFQDYDWSINEAK